MLFLYLHKAHFLSIKLQTLAQTVLLFGSFNSSTMILYY